MPQYSLDRVSLLGFLSTSHGFCSPAYGSVQTTRAVPNSYLGEKTTLKRQSGSPTKISARWAVKRAWTSKNALSFQTTSWETLQIRRFFTTSESQSTKASLWTVNHLSSSEAKSNFCGLNGSQRFNFPFLTELDPKGKYLKSKVG